MPPIEKNIKKLLKLMNDKKEKIKDKVTKKVNPFIISVKENIEFPDGTSIGETRTMISIDNLRKVLEMCFEETYKETIKIDE